MIPIRCAGKAFLIREDAKVSAPPTPLPTLFQSLLKVKCALLGGNSLSLEVNRAGLQSQVSSDWNPLIHQMALDKLLDAL